MKYGFLRYHSARIARTICKIHNENSRANAVRRRIASEDSPFENYFWIPVRGSTPNIRFRLESSESVRKVIRGVALAEQNFRRVSAFARHFSDDKRRKNRRQRTRKGPDDGRPASAVV
jgi:hypothetical protein